MSSVLHLLLMWSQYCHYYDSLVAQLCLTLCNPLDFATPPDSSVQGILQARILEWVAISFSRGDFLTWGLNPGWASLVAQMVKSLPEMQETWVWSLGWEDSPEKEMATYSNIFAWEILWMEEPGRLQSMGFQRVRSYWETSLPRYRQALYCPSHQGCLNPLYMCIYVCVLIKWF